MTHNDLIPDYGKMPDGLVPAIVQDAGTRAVLMLGYMNAEALEQTRQTGLVTFYSRSKQRLWTKGEISGNVMRVRHIELDCDQDTLLIQADPAGPVCHTGTDTCWGHENREAGYLHHLEQVIESRRDGDPAASYTARLFAAGVPKIAQKVGEEAVETVIEAMQEGNRESFLNESADLVFHFLVLLQSKGVRLRDVEAVLEARAAQQAQAKASR